LSFRLRSIHADPIKIIPLNYNYIHTMPTYFENRFSPLTLPGLQMRDAVPFCQGELLDATDAEHAVRKRSHSVGHSSLTSEQMDTIRRHDPVHNSIGKDVLSNCDSESTWEGENGNVSREASPSSSPISSVSDGDHLVTITSPRPAKMTTTCEIETFEVSSRRKFEDMLTNDAGVTLMIRNLPNKIMQSRIMQKLAEQNLQDQVRLVYVPVDFGHKQKTLNKGFAFIHTNDKKTADTIITMWHRTFAFGRDGVKRSLNIALAHTQGLMQNMENWRKSTTSRIRNPFYSPLLVMEGGETIVMCSFNFSDLLPRMKDAEYTGSTNLQSQVPAALGQ